MLAERLIINTERHFEPDGQIKTKSAARIRPPPPFALLGVAFDSVTIVGALSRIEKMIAAREPHYICTANVDFLVRARRDAELRRVLNEAHLVLCDGTPLVWASRLLGRP